MNTKQELQKDWEQISEEVLSIEESIIKTKSPMQIIPLAEKIGVLNRSIQSITIKTLNTLLNIDQENPLICNSCNVKMDIFDNSIFCENPSCELNDYE